MESEESEKLKAQKAIDKAFEGSTQVELSRLEDRRLNLLLESGQFLDHRGHSSHYSPPM
ncbi:MAG: hypothetical protein Q7S47_01140 [bacterium]|nr:hypothetical protein [bacterium]